MFRCYSVMRNPRIIYETRNSLNLYFGHNYDRITRKIPFFFCIKIFKKEINRYILYIYVLYIIFSLIKFLSRKLTHSSITRCSLKRTRGYLHTLNPFQNSRVFLVLVKNRLYNIEINRIRILSIL